MHRFFAFLAMVGTAALGETETEKELQQQLNMLKTAFEKEIHAVRTELENNKETIENIAEHSNFGEMKTMQELKIKFENNEKKTNEAIETLKKEMAILILRSTFCGYKVSVNVPGPVSYTIFLLVDNNVPGASFDLASGRYTAGIEGTYRIDLSIGDLKSYDDINMYNVIYIQINGVSEYGSKIVSDIKSSSSSAENGGRSMMVRMKQNDYVNVYVENVYEINNIIFCVSLINASA